MSEVQSFVCPTCGAPLEIQGNEAQIKCEFCGNSVLVPEYLRPQRKVEQQMEAPVIMVQFPSTNRVMESSFGYPSTQDQRRSGGCFWRVFGALVVLFILSITIIPTLFLNSVVRDQIVNAINGAINQAGGLPTATRRASSLGTSTPTVPSVGRTSTPSATPLGGVKVADNAFVTFGGDGIGPGLFKDARRIAIDGEGNLYVSDWDTGRIQRLDPNGKYLNSWMLDGKKPIVLAMTVDRAGTVYVVVNLSTDTILKYDGETGKPLGKITSSGDRFQDITVLSDGKLQAMVMHNSTSDDLIRITSDGKVSNRISKAISNQTDSVAVNIRVAVDGLGNIFALSSNDYAIFKFTSSGKFVNRFGQRGEAPDQFKAFQEALVVDGKGNIYIGDFKGIMVFDSNGRYLNLLKIPPGAVRSMAFNDKNELYVLLSNGTGVKLNPAASAQ